MYGIDKKVFYVCRDIRREIQTITAAKFKSREHQVEIAIYHEDEDRIKLVEIQIF